MRVLTLLSKNISQQIDSFKACMLQFNLFIWGYVFCIECMSDLLVTEGELRHTYIHKTFDTVGALV